MTTTRETFIQQFFHFIAQYEYRWLKAVAPHPTQAAAASDIDLFIRRADLPAVLRFVENWPDVSHFEKNPGHEATYISLLFADGSFLKLDLLTALVRKQWQYLPENYLLLAKHWKNGVATCPPEVLLEHVLLFNFLNHSGLSEKYVHHFSDFPLEEQALLLSFINGKYGTAFQGVPQLAHFDPAARAAFCGFLKKTADNTWPRRLGRTAAFLRRKIKSGLRPIGLTITLSGVDGAGKTTLLNDLKHLLEQQFQHNVVVLRHRPSVLPILSAWVHGRAGAEQKSVSRLPRQGQNQHQIGSLLRFAYYFSDYLFGQVFVWFRYKLLGYTVIYDRYYFDFIVDGKRSNLALGERLPKWLYRFVAKPDLNVFLFAPPSVIRERKMEMPAADIEEMTEKYKLLFKEFGGRYSGKYVCLENIDREQSLLVILENIKGGISGVHKTESIDYQLVVASKNHTSYIIHHES